MLRPTRVDPGTGGAGIPPRGVVFRDQEQMSHPAMAWSVVTANIGSMLLARIVCEYPVLFQNSAEDQAARLA